jgi:25S rRNA (adenine2142-N1)-methyltransferase
VTSLFHKYTRELDAAKEKGNPARVEELEQQLDELGGREAYQQASQLSTSFYSTSKWVIGHLTRSGWLYGIHEQGGDKKGPRRNTKLLEVGAINTELLVASKQIKRSKDGTQTSKYRLSVRAIDLRSSHEGIEEADFLTFPLGNYDVVVCSMVINCVPRPEQRGLMLARLYHHLVPGGLCFLTLPRLCLNQSPHMSLSRFQKLLSETGVGFQIEETKESPKVAFFILRRPIEPLEATFDQQWTKSKVINRGKKFRNVFNVTLIEGEVNGKLLA